MNKFPFENDIQFHKPISILHTSKAYLHKKFSISLFLFVKIHRIYRSNAISRGY